jgi:dihydrofolate reductase
MAKVLVANHVTLDGVMQAPAREDEDRRDGFDRGGWAAAGSDALIPTKIGERMGEPSAFLFGRRTYEDFYAVWPNRPESPFSEALTRATKYVTSRTLHEPLPWSNSVLLHGEAVETVARVKRSERGSLTIFGSGELIGSLMGAGLIDEYLLMIHPLVLGSGRRLFPPGVQADLQLVETIAAPTGVVIAAYQPRRPTD